MLIKRFSHVFTLFGPYGRRLEKVPRKTMRVRQGIPFWTSLLSSLKMKQVLPMSVSTESTAFLQNGAAVPWWNFAQWNCSKNNLVLLGVREMSLLFESRVRFTPAHYQHQMNQSDFPNIFLSYRNVWWSPHWEFKGLCNAAVLSEVLVLRYRHSVDPPQQRKDVTCSKKGMSKESFPFSKSYGKRIWRMLILLQRPFYRICRPPESKGIPDSVGLQGQQAGGCIELFGFLSLRLGCSTQDSLQSKAKDSKDTFKLKKKKHTTILQICSDYVACNLITNIIYSII